MKAIIQKTLLFIGGLFIIPFFTAAQQPGEISYQDISELPSGKEGLAIEQLLVTINSNDSQSVATYLDAYCTPSFKNMAPLREHLSVFKSVFRQTGGIDFHSIRSYTPARPETVVIVKDRIMGDWSGVTFNFDENQMVSGLNFSPARTPTNVEPVDIVPENLADEVAKYVLKACERDRFSGTVLVALKDQVIYESACGEATKRFHVPNNLDTKFNLGSMNKMFTSTAICKLIESGKVKLEDKIDQYVDESWLPKEITEKITIKHLLTHTSGLGSYFNDTYWKGSRELYRTVNDFKPLVQGDKLAFEPGDRFRYSNTGMLILGVVIESVSGMDYFDFIRKEIYQPAGMHHTDCYEMDYPVENLAIGYIPTTRADYSWENNLYKHVIKGGPAGGGFSTVRDLHQFAYAMLTNQLVSAEMQDQMWTDHSDAYGFGFGIEEGDGGKVVGHGGGFPGLNGDLDIFVESGYIVAVLSNYDHGAQPIARKINMLIRSMLKKGDTRND